MEASTVQLQELYEDFMESVYPSGNVDEVFHIIWDEAASFFEGNKKSIDVVRAIDNRIQLLLDEWEWQQYPPGEAKRIDGNEESIVSDSNSIVCDNDYVYICRMWKQANGTFIFGTVTEWTW